jgi:hypothetical protein
MKKALRLTLLAGAVGLASWITSEPPAHAVGLCDDIQGVPCSTPGRTQRCSWDVGFPGQCVCDSNGYWYCS